MGYRVGLSDAAQDDLGTIVRFLAKNNAGAAERLGNELLDAALTLTVFPRRGSPVRRRPGMRKLTYHNYLIYYQVNDSSQWVEVVRIWDGRQDPAVLCLP